MRFFFALLFGCAVLFGHGQSKTTFTVYFALDKAAPTEASQKSLSAFLQELSALPVTAVTVKGYTDKAGSEDYNRRLSQRRADGVAQQCKTALPTADVAIGFYGEQDLVTDDDDGQDRNRRVQLYVRYAPPTTGVLRVQGFFEDVEEQRFAVDFSDTVVVTGKGGTVIKFPPGSVQNNNGQAVSGRAEILLKEYYEAGDILLAGMHSSSKEGLLQTGGMFRLLVLQNGDTLAGKTKKKVTVQMPVRNTALNNMTAFTMNHAAGDTARWRDTRWPFRNLAGFWQWPRLEKLRHAVPDSDVRLEFWRVGSTYTQTASIGPWICVGCGDKHPTKSVDLSFRKIGRDSLRVQVKANYRGRASRRFGQRKLDTSYLVTFRRPVYEGEIGELNFINCDRFYNNPNTTDFYVTTPGFKGMNVLAYFKRLNAFMLSAAGPDDYLIGRVPENEDVYIVAFAKKEKDYFLSIQPYTVQRNGRVAVSFAKMDEAAFKNELKQLER